MTIKYEPSKMLRKIAPARKVEKMLGQRLSLKRAALSFVADIDFLDTKAIERVALKTIKGYRERAKDDEEAKAEILDDPAQLIQRVQNEVVTQISDEIKGSYHGERYVWLPSDAEEPDAEHQLNYGKEFEVGVGEMPGDRYGCRCGMEILVDHDQLEL